jgi:hypothetical protein
MEKLPEDFKRKWLEALRSGKYKQGQTFLLRHGCRCVMGVAGAVLGIPDEILDGRCCPYTHLGFPAHLSFSSDIPTHPVTMNDDGKSFAEIADWIEENL